MDAQEYNLCLLKLPVLVLEKILSNIHNPSIVSRTCRYLYEIVCDMEKRRRGMYISGYNVTPSLNIDIDAVFDSIMNSHRTIKAIELRVIRTLDVEVVPSYELNERQLERVTAIMKQFGANVTSLKLDKFVLPINFILELLQQTPNLESLSFTDGNGMGSVAANAAKSLHLPSLKALKIKWFTGLSDIVKLIPAGSLNFISYTNYSTKVLTTLLTKQHKIKSLHLGISSNSNIAAFRTDHLQLETLIFRCYSPDMNVPCLEILRYQTNLKELRFKTLFHLSGSEFQWICHNLKKLEVFKVHQMDSIEGNALKMLGELKKLRHFRTSDSDYWFDNRFQSSQFQSDSIEKFEIGSQTGFSCGELLNKIVNSMAHRLPKLTHLEMNFENFSTLCFVLGHCKKIIHLSSSINDPNPDQLTQQRFPNIQFLELSNLNRYDKVSEEMMSQSMASIVRAMPNLMRMSIRRGLKFNVNTLKEFIKKSKSLEYFYVSRFELRGELSVDDVVESIRCLTDQLEGYRIKFCLSLDDLNWHKMKDILSNEFYVRHDNSNRHYFYLYKVD